MGRALQPAPAGNPVAFHYERRRPEETTLYRIVREQLETFLAQVEAQSGSGLPAFVKDEFEALSGMRRSPLEFMQRLAALVPRPRLHLIRFHGVLAPNARLRAAIVPGAAEKSSEHAARPAHEAAARTNWARLLRRVFDIDLEHCPQCGGDLKIIAAIEEPAVIAKILTHLGLPSRASPRAPARRLDLFHAA